MYAPTYMEFLTLEMETCLPIMLSKGNQGRGNTLLSINLVELGKLHSIGFLVVDIEEVWGLANLEVDVASVFLIYQGIKMVNTAVKIFQQCSHFHTHPRFLLRPHTFC